MVLEIFRLNIHKEIFNLVTVDKAHLFLQFALCFRDNFLALKSTLFKMLINKEVGTLVPVLFMTVTSTKLTIDHLTLMIGLSFTAPNCFWPSAEGILTKMVLVKFQYKSRPFTIFKSSVKRLYNREDNSTKWI